MGAPITIDVIQPLLTNIGLLLGVGFVVIGLVIACLVGD